MFSTSSTEIWQQIAAKTSKINEISLKIFSFPILFSINQKPFKKCGAFQPSDYDQYSCGWYEQETFDELEIVGRQAWACRDGDAETQACSSALEDTKFVHPDNRDANDQYEEISHLQIKL